MKKATKKELREYIKYLEAKEKFLNMMFDNIKGFSHREFPAECSFDTIEQYSTNVVFDNIYYLNVVKYEGKKVKV